MSAQPVERTPYDGLRIEGKEHAVAVGADGELTTQGKLATPRSDRMVSLRALLDALSMWLIVAGGGLGVAAAAVAGGTVPALATGGGVLVGVGLLLTL